MVQKLNNTQLQNVSGGMFRIVSCRLYDNGKVIVYYFEKGHLQVKLYDNMETAKSELHNLENFLSNLKNNPKK